jgi:PBP1b-binding outer membrane lipoprotein LpoB
MKNNMVKTISALALIGLLATGCSSTKEGTNASDSTTNSTDTVGMSGTSIPDTVRTDSL